MGTRRSNTRACACACRPVAMPSSASSSSARCATRVRFRRQPASVRSSVQLAVAVVVVVGALVTAVVLPPSRRTAWLSRCLTCVDDKDCPERRLPAGERPRRCARAVTRLPGWSGRWWSRPSPGPARSSRRFRSTAPPPRAPGSFPGGGQTMSGRARPAGPPPRGRHRASPPRVAWFARGEFGDFSLSPRLHDAIQHQRLLNVSRRGDLARHHHVCGSRLLRRTLLRSLYMRVRTFSRPLPTSRAAAQPQASIATNGSSSASAAAPPRLKSICCSASRVVSSKNLRSA